MSLLAEVPRQRIHLFTEGDYSGTPPLQKVLEFIRPYGERIERNGELRRKHQSLLPFVPDLSGYLKRTGEMLINVESVNIELPQSLISPEEALMRATHAENIEELGKRPPDASFKVPEIQLNRPDLELFVDAFFPRDALKTGMATLELFPNIMRSTLKACAQYQALREDPFAESKPGQIAHEIRPEHHPVAQEITNKAGWKIPYYGAEDTTALFINGFLAYINRYPEDGRRLLTEQYEGQDGQWRPMAHTLLFALDWLRREREKNPEGLIAFKTVHPLGSGIENQCWKDAGDSISLQNGILIDRTKQKAVLEIQVDAVNAFHGLGWLFPYLRRKLSQEALELEAKILETFWRENPDGTSGFYAMAAYWDNENNLQVTDTLTSNSLYSLRTPFMRSNHPEAVRRRDLLLRTHFTEDMITPAGHRTLHPSAARYHSDSYHNGSVWPEDVREIAEELIGVGYYGLGLDQLRRIREAVEKVRIYAEKFRGTYEIAINTRVVDVILPDGRQKRIIQLPQPGQTWTVGAYAQAVDLKKRAERGKIPTRATDPHKRFVEDELLEKIA